MSQNRPPVVTIMGHVDHGKTSLLDYIRQAHVAAGEAGGITQHIGAYQAEWQGHKITFIDTPGHAAFSKMRSRGANITDIAVLVVAADDGVMPQTIESIKFIQAAGVPMIVAINKVDLPGVNIDAVKAQLTEHGVYVTGYGGDVEVVPLSAKSGQGVPQLLETLVTLGELLELQADPTAPFRGVVVESSKDRFLGSVATIICQQGTLRTRDPLYSLHSPDVNGSVRTMTNQQGAAIQELTPGMPAELTGFSHVPEVGSIVLTQAAVAQEPATTASTEPLPARFNLPDLGLQTPKVRYFIKADVGGSLEALIEAISANEHVTILGSGIGDVSESDLQFAQTAQARILAFQTRLSGSMKKLAARMEVPVRVYRIIYELLDDVEKDVRRLLKPEEAEVVTGEAAVQQIFTIRGDVILGCKVQSGIIRKGDSVHVKRAGEVLFDAKVSSLKQGKLDLGSVTEDEECGLVLASKAGVMPAPGDVVTSYKIDSSL